MQLNQFQNAPVLHRITFYNSINWSNGRMKLQKILLPGDLSFNNFIMLLSASGTTSKTMTISMGLFSLNGATLSAANSASFSNTYNANTTVWITFATSAAQNISSGTWFVGIARSTAGNSRMHLGALGNAYIGNANAALQAGQFWGIATAFSTSLNTSAVSWYGDANDSEMVRQPVFLISA